MMRLKNFLRRTRSIFAPRGPTCEKELWKTRWAQIIIAPVVLLAIGAVLVALLWVWTRQKLLGERSRMLDDVHGGGMTALQQSVSTFMSIMSIYSHAIETFEFLPFQLTETMFGPMLQRANFSQGTCAYFSRVDSLEMRMLYEGFLSLYVGRQVRFTNPYDKSALPLNQSEYWIVTHGDSGLSPLYVGLDYSNVSVIMEQIYGAVNHKQPFASQTSVSGPLDSRLFLITDASYKCDATLFRNLDSKYDVSQIKPRGSLTQCLARQGSSAQRMAAVTGAVTCTTLVKSFFQSPVFMDEGTCFRVTDVETNTLLWKSTTSQCADYEEEYLLQNRSAPIDPVRSIFSEHGRDWELVHYALPVELQAGDVTMLAGYSSLFVAMAAGVTVMLFLRERTRTQDLRVEHSKRESLRVFLDTTSHDMRSPLQASMNLVHLIIAEQKDRLHPGGLEDLRTLQHTLLLLEDIVSNVLDFQKIEAGTVQFGAEKNIDILSELRNLLQIVGHGAAIKSQCRFTFQVVPKNNARVTCDRARICRAVMNVVSNALKFTKIGFVDVVVSVLSANSEVLQLHVVVQDSGPGISDSMLSRLFLAYEGAGINDGGGSGLGMFITKAVVDHYNGNIFVNSKVGEGSCFTLHFQLPVTPSVDCDPLSLDDGGSALDLGMEDDMYGGGPATAGGGGGGGRGSAGSGGSGGGRSVVGGGNGYNNSSNNNNNTNNNNANSQNQTGGDHQMIQLPDYGHLASMSPASAAAAATAYYENNYGSQLHYHHQQMLNSGAYNLTKQQQQEQLQQAHHHQHDQQRRAPGSTPATITSAPQGKFGSTAVSRAGDSGEQTRSSSPLSVPQSAQPLSSTLGGGTEGKWADVYVTEGGSVPVVPVMHLRDGTTALDSEGEDGAGDMTPIDIPAIGLDGLDETVHTFSPPMTAPPELLPPRVGLAQMQQHQQQLHLQQQQQQQQQKQQQQQQSSSSSSSRFSYTYPHPHQQHFHRIAAAVAGSGGIPIGMVVPDRHSGAGGSGGGGSVASGPGGAGGAAGGGAGSEKGSLQLVIPPPPPSNMVPRPEMAAPAELSTNEWAVSPTPASPGTGMGGVYAQAGAPTANAARAATTTQQQQQQQQPPSLAQHNVPSAQSKPSSLTGKKERKRKMVLFAEDNHINMKTGVRILKSFGADVIAAQNGDEAWNLSKQHYGEVDLFLLDVNMPVLCGDEVVRRIRKLEADLKVPKPKPVFALTGHAEHQILEGLLEAGFTDVLTKPATPAGIRKLLHR